MTLENQVCSRPLSQRVKELGVKQDSLFVWCSSDEYGSNKESWFITRSNSGNSFITEALSAFTAGELGQYMRIGTDTVWDGQKWQVTYIDQEHVWAARENTEAAARAKMLIYLLENKLITL